MVTNICVLRSGGDFKPDHVIRLAKQVPNLVCLSDVEIEGVKTIPLKYDWPKWWAKLELCRPDIRGDLFYLDLDTTVLKMPFMPGRSCVLADFGDPSVIGSGLMFLKEKDRYEVWEDWIQDPERHMIRHDKKGDQGYLQKHLNLSQRWQRVAKVYSYKFHCLKGIPDDADVICHHGTPRPWEVGF